ncbi:MAG: acid phosphatase AphA [Chlorobiaceae bacterium]|nr:acid phosphatase AphA [Chlorobiaceae bacterium]NTW73930.1 acid phosphatase AphA [Chlorobiaceae bacterium]
MIIHLRTACVLVLLTAASACTSAPSVRYVTLAEIQASLPATPVVAGFDIDDTVLFSSPGFNYGLNNQDGPGGTNKYGESPLKSPVFWNDMNSWFDNFSLPKASGNALIQMHLKRGDRIVFITARDSSKVSIVPKILKQSFSIPKPEVLFTCDKPKRSAIVSKGVTIYYGDADSDMLAADSAKARPIRVLRSPFSTNRTSYAKVGLLGEEVLKDSEN